jgi:hypothetical protein
MSSKELGTANVLAMANTTASVLTPNRLPGGIQLKPTFGAKAYRQLGQQGTFLLTAFGAGQKDAVEECTKCGRSIRMALDLLNLVRQSQNAS